MFILFSYIGFATLILLIGITLGKILEARSWSDSNRKLAWYSDMHKEIAELKQRIEDLTNYLGLEYSTSKLEQKPKNN